MVFKHQRNLNITVILQLSLMLTSSNGGEETINGSGFLQVSIFER